MKIGTIRGSMETGEMVVILTEIGGDRILPISVSGDQAVAIHLGHQKIATPRPLTHDLMAAILQSLKVKVERIIITDLREGTYYAEIELKWNGRLTKVDARPSDAIALSLRLDSPISCMPHLLERMSEMMPDSREISHAAIAEWGIVVQPLTPALAEFFGRKTGVLLAEITAGELADKSGLEVGDVISAINGEAVDDLEEFLNAIQPLQDNKEVVIDYWRDGHNGTVEFLHQATSPRVR